MELYIAHASGSNSAKELEALFRSRGIQNIGSSWCYSTDPVRWYEEDGMDIRDVAVFIALVDQAFLDSQVCTWCTNTALNQEQPAIFVLTAPAQPELKQALLEQYAGRASSPTATSWRMRSAKRSPPAKPSPVSRSK